MFKFRIVKAETLNKLQADLAEQQRVTDVLKLRLDNLSDQAERNNKAVNKRFNAVERNAALADSKVCPLLAAVPKHVVDPMGAWKSKQLVLEQRLKYVQSCIMGTLGNDYALHLSYRRDERDLIEQLHIHRTRKPIIVQLPPKETAVVVRHKKYGTLGLLKGNHITILSKGNTLNVGDVITNATPAVVHKFWDIKPNVDMVQFNV